jgi:F0F1-type ATP synthase assembly protein I
VVENEKKSYWRDSMTVFAKMSGWVAGPILIGLFLGKWLDARFDTAPVLFAVTVGFSFMASCFGIVREAKKYMKQIEKETPPKNNINEPEK